MLLEGQSPPPSGHPPRGIGKEGDGHGGNGEKAHGGRREPDFPSKACFWMENLSRPKSPPWEVSQSPFRGSLVQLRAGSFQRPGFQHHSHTSGNQGWILRPLTRFGDPGPDFETPLTLWAAGAEFSNPSHTLGARGWIWRPLPHFGHPGPDFEPPLTLCARG